MFIVRVHPVAIGALFNFVQTLTEKGEHTMQMVRQIYTHVGPQSPIAVQGGQGRFVLTLQPGDVGRIETTCDPIVGGKYRPRWDVFEGGLAGAVGEIMAVRAVITHLEGWAELMVETAQETAQEK
ncbi:MAG: hypothetical protein ACK5YK_00330 [Pseudomonadota bacterium]